MDSILKQRIREAKQFMRDQKRRLLVLVEALDNHMNECQCDCREAIDFNDVSTETEGPTLCVNCGGYVEPKDLELY